MLAGSELPEGGRRQKGSWVKHESQLLELVYLAITIIHNKIMLE